MKYLNSVLLNFVFLFFTGISSLSAYKVVASIPPIAALIREIADDKVSLEVLMDGSESPHTYALKPSDLKKIENADVIFWIGPTYETFLEKPIQTASSKNISLIQTADLTLHPVHAPASDSDSGCPYCEGGKPLKVDSHIWLDPDNGFLMAQLIAQHLSEKDPTNKDFYQNRLGLFKSQIQKLKNRLQQQLAPLSSQVFFVFHDGYQYFEKAFNLKGGHAIMEMPDENLSIQRLTFLKKMILKQKSQCLFAESQFSSRLINKLSLETNIKIAVLDPLGNEDMSYINILQNLSEKFSNCFEKIH